jgi:hypothetical protein
MEDVLLSIIFKLFLDCKDHSNKSSCMIVVKIFDDRFTVYKRDCSLNLWTVASCMLLCIHNASSISDFGPSSGHVLMETLVNCMLHRGIASSMRL